MTQISAKIRNNNETRISQCDLFRDIDIVEKIKEGDNGIEITNILCQVKEVIVKKENTSRRFRLMS